MFGYVRTCDEELRVREYRAYRAIYCGLCRALGKNVNRLSRLSLSYDFVFLAILRYKAEGVSPNFGEIRCAGKRKPAAESDEILGYCARAGALLTWHKLNDDVNDSRGARRLAARALRGMAGGMRKKADLPELDGAISERIDSLSALEKRMADGDPDVTPDVLAEESGRLLAGVFSYGTGGEVARILSEAGLRTGRWIYFADAADDYAEDRKRGRFNPFSGGGEPDTESIRCAMLLELKSLKAAVGLLPEDGGTLDELADNITGYGMTSETEEIMGRFGEGKKRKKSGGKLRERRKGRI